MWWALVAVLVLLAVLLIALKENQWQRLIRWLEICVSLPPWVKRPIIRVHYRIHRRVRHSKHWSINEACDKEGSRWTQRKEVGETAPYGQPSPSFSQLEAVDVERNLLRETGSKWKLAQRRLQKKTSEMSVTTVPDTRSRVEQTREGAVVTTGAVSETSFTTVLITWVPSYNPAPHIQHN